MSWGHVQPSPPSATVMCSPLSAGAVCSAVPHHPGLCAAQYSICPWTLSYLHQLLCRLAFLIPSHLTNLIPPWGGQGSQML